MGESDKTRRRPSMWITEEEEARRRDIISRSDHNMMLSGMTRGPVSARAAELWARGEITAEEKMAMVKKRLREIAAKNGADYKE